MPIPYIIFPSGPCRLTSLLGGCAGGVDFVALLEPVKPESKAPIREPAVFWSTTLPVTGGPSFKSDLRSIPGIDIIFSRMGSRIARMFVALAYLLGQINCPWIAFGWMKRYPWNRPS